MNPNDAMLPVFLLFLNIFFNSKLLIIKNYRIVLLSNDVKPNNDRTFT